MNSTQPEFASPLAILAKGMTPEQVEHLFEPFSSTTGGRVWAYRLFIKSFGIMVVQSTCAAWKAKEQRLPSNFQQATKRNSTVCHEFFMTGSQDCKISKEYPVQV
jgi:hypothetical protein